MYFVEKCIIIGVHSWIVFDEIHDVFDDLVADGVPNQNAYRVLGGFSLRQAELVQNKLNDLE